MTSAITNPSALGQPIGRPPVYEHRQVRHCSIHSLPSHHDLKAMLASFDGDRMELLSNDTLHEDKSIDDTISEQIRTVADFFKHTLFGHTVLQYGALIMAYFMFKEMGPVFMAQALSFNSIQIGYTQVCAGVTYFIWAVTIQPILLSKVKHTVLTGYCVVISAISALLMPSVLYWFTLIKEEELAFMNEAWWTLIMACVVECIGTMASSVVFTTTSCWLNINSVPERYVGKAYGIGQSLSAFVKGFGPLLTGFIWSESITQMANTHYAVYYAYLPAAILHLPVIIDILLYIPSDLQLTWMQRQEKRITNQ
eukprot:117985_1